MSKTLLLTGHPGSGKTALIQKIAKGLGKQAVGFYTEEIFGPGGRKGLKIVTLAGDSVVVIHKDFRDPSMPRLGRYGVDVAALDRICVDTVQKAGKAHKVLLMDEIGKVTMFSLKFQQALLGAILGPTLIVATIMIKPHPEADIFKTLAPVEQWEITNITRKTMAQQALKWVKSQQH